MSTLPATKPSERKRRRGSGESGQLVMLVAGGMIAVIGFAALAIDIGFFTHTKREVQNDADAMALAGVQELANRGLDAAGRETNATLEADAWALKNDVDPDEIIDYEFGVTCSGESVPDTMTVRLRRTQQTFLARVLGFNSADMNVCATARTGLAKGGNGLLPIGLLNDNPNVEDICYFTEDDDPDFDDEPHASFYYDPDDGGNLTYAPGGEDEKCVIKIPRPGAGDTWADGNTGPIRLDEISQVDPGNYRPDCDPGGTNSGGDEYGENIEDGSECPYGKGDSVRTLPGSQTGKTCTSFNDREAEAHASHNLTDVFTDPIYVDGKPIYTRVDVTSPHFGIIPVTTIPAGGTDWVTITRFVTVYVVGCETSGGGGNQMYTVTIIPVNSQYFEPGEEIVDPDDDESDFPDEWPAYTIKLIE